MAIKTAALVRNDEADAVVAYIGADGKLTIYDGSVPADADTALGGGNHALVTLVVPSWSVSGDTATAPAIEPAVADATGNATFFRVYKANGTTVAFQGSVGTSGADLILNDVHLLDGAAVSVLSASYQVAA